MIRTLVVDDVELARERIGRMLRAHDDVEVVGEASDGEAAFTAIGTLAPDLVILDIGMPGLDGMALARRLTSDGAPTVIFVTAHQEHALPAFEVAALDYLLKPVSPERLAEALDRVRRQSPAQRETAATLFVPDGGRSHYVPLDRIDFVEATGHYLVIQAGTESYLLREPLSALAPRLGGDFLRVHRSILVRLDRIASIGERRNGDGTAMLTTGASVRVSRTYRPALARRMERRCR